MHRCFQATLIVFFLSLSAGLTAQLLDVQIRPFDRLPSFTFQSLSDEVVVTSNDSFPVVLFRLNTLDQYTLQNEENGVRVSTKGKSLGVFPELLFWCNDSQPRFKIIPGKNPGKSKTYYGHLLLRPGARGVEMINRVHLEDYIQCVIHAEAGHHRTLDFYKVQALSARTYALRSLGRHKNHGFDLCDNTHCQAYKGEYAENTLLNQAVEDTKAEVIVYEGRDLIEAVFSANCGGFTANSEDVWVATVDYLRAVPDYDFCEGFSNHAWHVTIPKLDFLAKLGRYFKVEASSFNIEPDVSGRVKRIQVNNDPKHTISGEEIRRLFRLKSSKFHIYDANSLLFIEGHGFGHGVGMCQDGAYYLSKMGMDYLRILKHYYQGVEVISLDEVESQ